MINNNKISIASNFLSYYSIINIYGESGTGKTTLALQLIANYLLTMKRNEPSCIWVQASEQYPKKRLNSMYAHETDKLNYLEKNIYLLPKKTISSYYKQNKVLEKLFNPSIIPFGLKIIVIEIGRAHV